MRRSLLFIASLWLCVAAATQLHAQEVKATPGKFDFYVLNLSWAPEFCHNVEVLPEYRVQSEHGERGAERRKEDTADECGTAHGFVLHGLWPQNTNGTWPANCSDSPGPADYSPYLKDTPSLMLLKHEWTKHGTCADMPPDTFFRKGDTAFEALQTPPLLRDLRKEIMLPPDDLLRQFYAANTSYAESSLTLSCGRNYLTAVEACLDKTTLRPIACQNVPSCHANIIKIAPEQQ